MACTLTITIAEFATLGKIIPKIVSKIIPKALLYLVSILAFLDGMTVVIMINTLNLSCHDSIL